VLLLLAAGSRAVWKKKDQDWTRTAHSTKRPIQKKGSPKAPRSTLSQGAGA